MPHSSIFPLTNGVPYSSMGWCLRTGILLTNKAVICAKLPHSQISSLLPAGRRSASHAPGGLPTMSLLLSLTLSPLRSSPHPLLHYYAITEKMTDRLTRLLQRRTGLL